MVRIPSVEVDLSVTSIYINIERERHTHTHTIYDVLKFIIIDTVLILILIF